MKLTVLGCHGTFPGVDGACSGYLLQGDRWNFLIDCGNGTIARAQRYLPIEDIDAVILTHFHLDHTADAFPLKYALETKKARGQDIALKKLFCPAGPVELAGELLDGTVFDVETVRAGAVFSTDGCRLSFTATKHLIESYAVAVEAEGVKFFYSGDTGYCGHLAGAASGADLFLCESTFLENGDSVRPDHHLSAGAAGRIAAEAGAKMLLLTHFWYEHDREQYAEEAGRYFGQARTASELMTYQIGV